MSIPIRADLVAYQHISAIATRMYVGDLEAAAWALAQPEWSVVSVLEGASSFSYMGEHRAHLPFVLHKQAQPGLLNRAVAWVEIEIARQRPVLIHCAAGIERSPLVAAWLLARRLSFEPPLTALRMAYGVVKRRRPMIEDRTVWLPKDWEKWFARR